jgi:hypothetical protein
LMHASGRLPAHRNMFVQTEIRRIPTKCAGSELEDSIKSTQMLADCAGFVHSDAHQSGSRAAHVINYGRNNSAHGLQRVQSRYKRA